MKQHTEIIDGKEVPVKVYEPYKGPKKLTAKTTGRRSQKQIIKKKMNKKDRRGDQ